MFTYDEEKLSAFLKGLKIHELREIGDVAGVRSPSSYNFEPLKEEIIELLMEKKLPEQRSLRGRPRKSGGAGGPRLAALLEHCRVTEEELELSFSTSVIQLEARAPGPEFEEDFPEAEEREGVLETFPDGYGFVRMRNFEPGENDAYLSNAQIKRLDLRRGDVVRGKIKCNFQDKYAAMYRVIAINGGPAEGRLRPAFESFAAQSPNERLSLFGERLQEKDSFEEAERVAPLGRGQRAILVGPPGAGKTDWLERIASGLSENEPETTVIVVLADVRPEEETAFLGQNLLALSSCTESAVHHVRVAELALDRAKRIAEQGGDAVVLVDSLTRLALAFCMASEEQKTVPDNLTASGLIAFKKFFGSARKLENGGSLTIVGTVAEVDSGVEARIFKELRALANAEWFLSKDGAFDSDRSRTRNAERLHEAI